MNPATCNCENGKYLVSIMDDSAIIFDEIIDADAESKSYTEAKSNSEAKPNNKETETNFNEISTLLNAKFLYFPCIFINYYSSIDTC